MVTGNTFGFCAFTGYGAFWIALCTMLLFKRFDVSQILLSIYILRGAVSSVPCGRAVNGILLHICQVYPMTEAEVGWFLVAFTVFTAVLWVGSLRLSRVSKH
jgi:succinate-acetate transporter protein